MYIIKDINEFHLIKSKKKVIAENLITSIKLKNNDIKYLYSSLESMNNNFHEDFCFNWYKKIRQPNKINKNNISIIQSFTRPFLYEVLNFIKLRTAIKNVSGLEKKIYVFEDNSDFINMLKILIKFDKSIQKKVIFLKLKKKEATHYISLGNRGKISKGNFKKYVPSLVSFVQKIIFIFMKKKHILYLKDWSSKEFFNNSQKVYTLNSKNLFKSFFFLKDNTTVTNEEIFFKKLDKIFLNKKILKNIFKKNNILLDDQFFLLLNFLINKIVKKNTNTIIEYIKYFSGTLLFYKPKTIILSEGSSFQNLLMFYIAKEMSLNVVILVDGYQTVKDYHGLIFDNKKNDTLSDIILCPGKSYENLMIKHNIPKKKLFSIFPPILSNNLIKKKIQYDGLIVSYIPNTRNLSCTYESYILTELEILRVFSLLRYKKIAIKIKEGSKSLLEQQLRSFDLYSEMYEKMYKNKLDLNIDFVSGKFADVIIKGKPIVGAFSTSFFESLYQKIPYYIYEPNRNGLHNKDLKANQICNKRYILKSMFKLKTDLLNKNYSSANKDIFKGKNIKQLDKFLEIFNG